MESKVKKNAQALHEHNKSMAVAIGKALKGSEVEDMYFIEKLVKTANILGLDLVNKFNGVTAKL